MIARLLALPLFVILMGVGAAAMLLPAFHAGAVRDFETARVFFYDAVLFGILTGILGLATVNFTTENQARSHLLSLLFCFSVLPLMLAVPFQQTVSNTTFLNAYFEMVSSITTTGATLFDDPARLPKSLHLWRAFVAWLGGFFVWVTAVAILAPLNLGGFEVAAITRRNAEGNLSQISRVADSSERLAGAAMRLLPVYSGLTAAVWIGLILAGDVPFVAFIHALSAVSTSGISATGGLMTSESGWLGEVVVLAALVFALSRLTFSADMRERSFAAFVKDPEIRIAGFLVLALPSMLFVRHWFGALEVDSVEDPVAAASAFWGGMFTVISFLTTAGFESASWDQARNWSGLATPGLILIGLAMIGGGVATTAGGVKLLRVYALYKSGQRELERLVHPSSVAGGGEMARHLRRQGAYVAWIFFMLFAISIAVILLMLSFTGIKFESSLILAISTLSTTGPLANVVGETPISYGTLAPAAKAILAGAMVLGRLETLAIVALLNPDTWRR